MIKDQENIKKINIEVNIGGEPFTLSVPFQDQERVREVEDEINAIYSQRRHTFPDRSEKKLMAMLLYQYASRLNDLTRKYHKATRLAQECSDNLDSLLDSE